jgi:hypothetical protein
MSSTDAAARRLSLTPLRRIGEPWEVSAALFLPGYRLQNRTLLGVGGGTLVTDGN